MNAVDRLHMSAPPARVFEAAANVERWPSILPHYRWVRARARGDDGEITEVEMAAWRPFGPFNYPTWWVSRMWIDRDQLEVRYRHLEGITRGMDVVWKIESAGSGSDVCIVHQWEGPAWPVIRRPAADWIIGPVFVHGIASRTLAGIRRFLESNHG